MYKSDLDKAKQAIAESKEKAKDMEIIAEELRALPKGQLKKLQASERLTGVLTKYGVTL